MDKKSNIKLNVLIILLSYFVFTGSDCPNSNDPPKKLYKDKFAVTNEQTQNVKLIDASSSYTIDITKTYQEGSSKVYCFYTYSEDNENYQVDYQKLEWTIKDVENLPSNLEVTIQQYPEEKRASALIYFVTKGPINWGTYSIRVVANPLQGFNEVENHKRHSPNFPVEFTLNFVVNVPLPKLTPKFQFDTLFVAPGETKTNLMTLYDIKPGQSFRIDHATNNSEYLKTAWVSVTDTVFTVDKTTATWSVAVPATANPNVDYEGINMFPTYLNNNQRIDFEGNRNGFSVFIAGFVVSTIDVKGGPIVKFGDTATISVDYVVNGNGVFTPKIVPVTTYPPDMLEITMPFTEQNLNSTLGKRLVKVTYKVFFKRMPTNKNVSFDVGGDITYGKAVSKRLLFRLQ